VLPSNRWVAGRVAQEPVSMPIRRQHAGPSVLDRSISSWRRDARTTVRLPLHKGSQDR
jgi:hypothetical protein